MPLKVFFRSGPTISRRDDFLEEVHPGAFAAYPDYIHYPTGDTIGYVVLASCLRTDAWSEVHMLRPDEVDETVNKGNPSVYRFADHIIEAGGHHSLHVGPADNPTGILTLVHSIVKGRAL
jgi:hypothetical protein